MDHHSITETAKQVSVEGVYVAVAAAGGIARYLQKYLEEGKFGFRHLIAHTIVSAFSGYMFGEFGLWLGMGERALFLLVGIGGYMGTESLKVIETIIKKRFTKKL